MTDRKELERHAHRAEINSLKARAKRYRAEAEAHPDPRRKLSLVDLAAMLELKADGLERFAGPDHGARERLEAEYAALAAEMWDERRD